MPFHVLVGDRKSRTNSVCIKQHLFLGEVPPGEIWATDLGFDVTSPLMTAFVLSRHLSDLELLLILTELLGSFAAYRPPAELEAAYRRALDGQEMPRCVGWRRFPNENAASSALWKRAPLVTAEQLQSFCEAIKGYRGACRFARIARVVPAPVASPFEAEAALLLGLPRNRGGAGFNRIFFNKKVKLDGPARRIANKSCFYIDVLLESEDGECLVAVECQGRAAHGAEGAGLEDATRMTALQSMGYRVFLLTHEQIKSIEQFRMIERMLCGELGISYLERSQSEKAAELSLRQHLFIDWTELGLNSGVKKREGCEKWLWRL